ncbi:MAG TPA: hypothetical protein VKB46_03360 [Pyrinomonadaceae bacterium]|nr:hypothetical protein [Pyrinomonadaceae bacterium]
MAPDGSNQRQLTPAGHIDENPSVTADGHYLVFESDRSGSSEIWRVNRVGGNLQQLTTGGNNKQPSVSPDGQWVVYISSRTALGPLWRVSLAGGEPSRLSDGQTGWPRISPDGKQVACAYSTRGESSETSLAIMPIDGGKPVHLFKVPGTANFRYGVRWTPDGLAVTYRDWFNGIWRQPLIGGDPQRLVGLPGEKIFSYGWSRDGKEFAFARGSEIRDVVLILNQK